MASVVGLDTLNASADTLPNVRLYACVVKKQQEVFPGQVEEQTEYGIDIRNLKIFGGIMNPRWARQVSSCQQGTGYCRLAAPSALRCGRRLPGLWRRLEDEQDRHIV
jgi:hypothetical protein